MYVAVLPQAAVHQIDKVLVPGSVGPAPPDSASEGAGVLTSLPPSPFSVV